MFTLFTAAIVLIVTFALFNSQTSNGSNYKLNAADIEGLISTPDLLQWNPAYDPTPTPGDCVDFSYNAILLFDRSPEYLATLSLDQLTEFKSGVKRTLDEMSLFARARNGHARVILGAYATYNVWQNMPEARQIGTSWTAADEASWRNSIDISVPANLETMKGQFDSIYIENTPASSTSGFSPTNPITAPGNLAYKGGEPSRDFWDTYPIKNGWGKDNLHDALIQSAREISRWAGGATTVAANQDIDLVLALTSGQPTANNGTNLFPSKTGITTNPPLSLWTLATSTNWYDQFSGPDDIYRAQDIVAKIRKGEALGKPYTDPNLGTPNQLRDSVPAYAGARPPARVYGHAVIGYTPTSNFYTNEFLHMAQIFGEEYKDYTTIGKTNPPTGRHRHWDKTVGNIKSGEVLSDMTLSLFDGGCTPAKTPIRPAISVVADNGLTSINEGDSGTVYANVVNTGDVPLQNVEIWYGASEVDNRVSEQIEKDCYLFDIKLPEFKYSCHETVEVVRGKKYAGGHRIKVIPRLEVGASVPVSYSIKTELGASSGKYPFQAWGQGIYDFTSKTPPAPSSNQNGGYVWGEKDTGFVMNRGAFPA